MNSATVITCKQAKKKDIIDYLALLGHHPVKENGVDYWYLSPLRVEKTASFKVNRDKNVWFDHGTGKGGNILDFGILYHCCSVKEFLQKLNETLSLHPQPFTIGRQSEKKTIDIISVEPLKSLLLQGYIHQRRIAEQVAANYCREVKFLIRNKPFLTIGFANDQGGYELRNSWFKGSSSPKAITTIKTGAKNLSVFEGFFNFLSFRSIQSFTEEKTDFLILNSVAFFEKNRPLMEDYERIQLYLDNDSTGQNCTRRALSTSHKYVDESKLYTGYKDLNDWIIHIGNPFH